MEFYKWLSKLFFFILIFTACNEKKPVQNFYNANNVIDPKTTTNENFNGNFRNIKFDEAGLPDSLIENISTYILQSPDFIMELHYIINGDPYLYKLVDKMNSLDSGYVPGDLAELGNSAYRVTRQGLTLRAAAADSLENMAAAALADGVTLTAASAFRTYEYQEEVYNRNVREMGQQAADRESARPGHSQHQLGVALDFFPIDDAFAETAASGWLEKNASRFGWSLSYPQGYEDITGYRWESWHYRYTGPELARFIDKYFNGIQQYALMFIHAWKSAE